MDPERLERELQLGLDPVSTLLRSLGPSIATLLRSGPVASPPPERATAGIRSRLRICSPS